MSTVIKVENLSKYYRLGLIGGGTFHEDLSRWIANLRGQPDPALKVGETDYGNRKGDQVWALKDVNFEVNEGEILGIIGRNGAGKSTLLKILSRITAPTEGKITIRGRVGSLLEVGTGFHPELTGRENIYLNGTILGMKKAEVDQNFEEIVEFAEMSKFIDTPVKRYSSGMTVRLAFAVAAHLEPEILVIDEVLAVGDAAFQNKCMGKMQDISGYGRTILFVSHNMNSIQTLCGSVMCMENGRVKETGKSQVVIENYLNTAFGENNNSNTPDGYIYFNNSQETEKNFQITGIQLFDANRKTITQIATWEYVRIRIHYSAKEFVNRGSVVLKIQTREGLPLILTSTQPDHNIPIKIDPGDHFIDCIFNKWPLAEGKYQLGVGLAIPMVEYLCWDGSICGINTIGRDVYESGKIPSSDRCLVVAEHHWEIYGSSGRRQ